MIKTETIAIGSKQFMHTYSTAGCYIERDGECYADAIDPIDSGRTYTETDVPIETEEEDRTGDTDMTPKADKSGLVGQGVSFERIRWITGYLVGTTDRFNDAKRAEEHDRVKHGIGK